MPLQQHKIDSSKNLRSDDGSKLYDDEFYTNLSPVARASAALIVPIILRLIEPRSVIDFGCGTGEWLATFAAHGITDFHGYDGGHVKTTALQIPPQRFTAHDLKSRVRISRQYDLAVSLEVAEHLQPEFAEAHVEQLTQVAPVVMFGAAIPGQGGTGHINEQWPDYWAQMFAKHKYRPVDAIRPQLDRFSDQVEFWYAQNILLYVKESCVSRYNYLAPWVETTRAEALAWVHPVLYLAVRNQLIAAEFESRQRERETHSLRRTMSRMPALVWRSLVARLHFLGF